MDQIRSGIKRPWAFIVSPDEPEFPNLEPPPPVKRQLLEAESSRDVSQNPLFLPSSPAPSPTYTSSSSKPTTLLDTPHASLASTSAGTGLATYITYDPPLSPYDFPLSACSTSSSPRPLSPAEKENFDPTWNLPLSLTLASTILSTNRDLMKYEMAIDPLLTSLCAARLTLPNAGLHSASQLTLEEREELEQLRAQWSSAQQDQTMPTRGINIAKQTISALRAMLSIAEEEQVGLRRDSEGFRRQVLDYELLGITRELQEQHLGSHRGDDPRGYKR